MTKRKIVYKVVYDIRQRKVYIKKNGKTIYLASGFPADVTYTEIKNIIEGTYED